MLEAEHYEVLRACDGSEAGAKFFHGEPDLILLDLNMPNGNGWRTFQHMENARPLRPFIIITARPDRFVHAQELGVDALMEKPLNLPVLLDAIKQLLAEPERERSRRLISPGLQTVHLNPRP